MDNTFSFGELAYGACMKRDIPNFILQPLLSSIVAFEKVGKLRRPGGAGSPRTALTVPFEEDILHRMEKNQSRTTVHRVLQEQLIYACHLQRVQALNSEDYPHRLGFVSQRT